MAMGSPARWSFHAPRVHPGLGSAHLSCRATWMLLDGVPSWRPVPNALNVRFGSFADMQQSPRERPLPGAKQTYLGQPRVGRRVYGKELFSVYPDGPAETCSAAGGKMAFSGGFLVQTSRMSLRVDIGN